MPRTCSICEHPKLEQINKAVMRQHSLRWIAARYEVSKSALGRHMKIHLPAAVKEIQKAEMPLIKAEDIGGRSWRS